MDSNLQSAQPPHGIMGLQELAIPWFYYLGLALLCLLLVWLAYLLWRRWAARNQKLKSAGERAAELQPLDPWLRIQKSFSALKIGESWQQETSEQFFFALSFILREAMELSSGLPFTSQTLAELKQSIKKSSFSANFKEELLEFLTLAETLKFAGQSVQISDAQVWREKIGMWLDRLYKGEG